MFLERKLENWADVVLLAKRKSTSSPLAVGGRSRKKKFKY